MKLNKASKKYLENNLATAINSLDYNNIRKILSLLGRKLTEEEKTSINERIKTAPDWQQIYLAKLTGGLTAEVFVTEIKRLPHTDIQNTLDQHKPTKSMIDAVITSFVKDGNTGSAIAWAKLGKRTITVEQAQVLLKTMTQTGKCSNGELLELIKLLPTQKLTLLQKTTLRHAFVVNKNYSGFWQTGGTKKDAPAGFFEQIAVELNNKGEKKKALTIVKREKLWDSKKITTIFTGFSAADGGLIFKGEEMLQEIQELAPANIVNLCAVSLIKDGHSFSFLIRFGFKINNSILKAYLLYLKTIGPHTTGWPHRFSIVENAKHFHRRLTISEKKALLNFIARTGDITEFFKIAEKYNFKPSEKMLRRINKKEGK